jgi:uncharacterized membrane protein
MHPEWAMYLRVLLTLHISCGVVGFVCAPVALAKAKGGKVHRRFGKIYFWAMAGVAVTALILSVALPVYFLTMVAVFSFYSAFAAYRVLYLKGMCHAVLKSRNNACLLSICFRDLTTDSLH